MKVELARPTMLKQNWGIKLFAVGEPCFEVVNFILDETANFGVFHQSGQHDGLYLRNLDFDTPCTSRYHYFEFWKLPSIDETAAFRAVSVIGTINAFLRERSYA